MKRKVILVIVLLVAFVAPYLSRIPGTITHGSEWFWSYLPSFSAFMFFGAFNLISLIPLLVVGIFFVRGKFKVSFALATLTHLVSTFWFHHNYDLAADAQAGIGLIFIPIVVGAITLAVGAVSMLVEWLVNRRRVRTSSDG